MHKCEAICAFTALSSRHAVPQLIVRRVDICGSAAVHVTVCSAALLKPYYGTNFTFTIYLFIYMYVLLGADTFIFDLFIFFFVVLVCLMDFGFCGSE